MWLQTQQDKKHHVRPLRNGSKCCKRPWGVLSYRMIRRYRIWLLWLVFSFNAACFISIKKTICQKTYLRNQHPGPREELCSMNYSVLSAFLTGNFSSLNSCSQQLFQSVGFRNNPLQQLFVQKVNTSFYISQQHLLLQILESFKVFFKIGGIIWQNLLHSEWQRWHKFWQDSCSCRVVQINPSLCPGTGFGSCLEWHREH